MSSSTLGNNILAVEVANISAHGVWLLTREKELFMPYTEFPWFADQPVKAIIHVEELSPGHFYWPDLDIDLTDEIIQNPKCFPLKARERSD
ncbi:MAG: DUF2442 domain-containing protein [Candidatus Electrothrix sp. AR3]|nr:DUF2442 domain-containing protein [Candidatus Electrothrix sp. AR3]